MIYWRDVQLINSSSDRRRIVTGSPRVDRRPSDVNNVDEENLINSNPAHIELCAEFITHTEIMLEPLSDVCVCVSIMRQLSQYLILLFLKISSNAWIHINLPTDFVGGWFNIH